MSAEQDKLLQQAVKAHKAGDSQAAERLYRSILEIDSAHPDANHNLGVLIVHTQDAKHALPYLKTALEANPKQMQYWLSAIDALIRADQIEVARNLLQRGQEKGLKGEQADKLVARIESSQGSKTSADSLPSEKLEEILSLYKQGKFEELIQQENTLMEEFSQVPSLINILAELNFRFGRFSKAIELYKRAIQLKPDYAEAYNNMGVAYKESNDFSAAIESYKKAFSIHPGLVEAYNNLGLAFNKQGEYQKSIETYKKALELKPDYAEAHNNLGVIYNELYKHEEAVISYNKAIYFNSEYVSAYYNLGNAFSALDNNEDAVINFKKAIQLNPNHFDAHSNLGVPLLALGRYDEALEIYNMAIELDPKNKITWNNIIYLFVILPLYGSTKLDSFQNKLRVIDADNVNYDILQYKLASFQPHLADSSFDDVINVISANSADEVANPQAPDQSTITPSIPDKMIALLHFGRSGTGLLHSLIDNHSEISMLPSIYFSEYFGTIYKENENMWKALTINGWDQIPENFVRQYEVLFDASSSVPILNANLSIPNIGQLEGMANVGEKGDEVLTVDRDVFCRELRLLMRGYPKLDASTFFTLVHVAYEATLNNSSDKQTIFYHIHNPTVSAKLNFLRYRPDTRFIMMVREPLQSCESWLLPSAKDGDYKKVSNRIIQMLFDIDQIAFRKCDSVGVRLEDLKLHPEATISSLCDWMGIKEEPGLYEMTAQGQKWWGDPSSVDYSEEGMSPFDGKSIKRKIGSIFSDRDQFILRTFFYPFSVRFGYVEEDIAGFRRDLIEVKPMLEELFDFEKQIASDRDIDLDMYKKSVSYLYLRAGLLDRWKVLNEFSDYPHMLTPLKIELNT